MRTTIRSLAREVHFVASLLLALLLVFFAITGFMAEHREWFHERIDREALADEVPLPGPCTPDALLAAAGSLGVTGGATRAVGGAHELAGTRGGADVRLRCLPGGPVAWLGEVVPVWPALLADERWIDDRLRERFGGRIDRTEVRGLSADEGRIRRFASPWRTTTTQLLHDEGVVVAWVKTYPAAHALIELHRGRGATERLIDVTAALAVLVSLSGVLHGLRYPGRRRRVLAVLLLGSALLVGALIAG